MIPGSIRLLTSAHGQETSRLRRTNQTRRCSHPASGFGKKRSAPPGQLADGVVYWSVTMLVPG